MTREYENKKKAEKPANNTSSRPNGRRSEYHARPNEKKPFSAQPQQGRRPFEKKREDQSQAFFIEVDEKQSASHYHSRSNSHTNSHEGEHGPESTLLPGVKPVLELLETSPEKVDTVYLRKGRHGREMDQIIDICRDRGIRFSLLDTEAFARAVPIKAQGVAARLFEAGFVEPQELFDTVMDAPLPLLVMLDQVQDPGNAGTLARTLYAFGGAGLIVPRHNGVYLGAAAQKASAGALERLPVAKAGNLSQTLEQAHKLGFTLYGTGSVEKNQENSMEASVIEQDIFTFTPHFPAILLLGSEESGLRQGLKKRCDALLSIPMLRDFDSLNVAQAGAVCLSAFLRHALTQRKS